MLFAKPTEAVDDVLQPPLNTKHEIGWKVKEESILSALSFCLLFVQVCSAGRMQSNPSGGVCGVWSGAADVPRSTFHARTSKRTNILEVRSGEVSPLQPDVYKIELSFLRFVRFCYFQKCPEHTYSSSGREEVNIPNWNCYAKVALFRR